MRVLSLLPCLLLLGAVAPAQDAQPAPAPKEKPKVDPLPEGKTRILEAVVIEVEGKTQARPEPEAKWADLKLNQVLKPGATIRTGPKSHVALRVGPNASMLVDRQSRVTLPEIIQDGAVLRTRVKMSFGKADVRVDRVGLDNDFEVATPTATLAVRGTTLRITWDAVQGFAARGVQGNRLRAIEVRYLDGVLAWLSHSDSSSDLYRMPALREYYKTYYLPLKGAVDDSQLGDPTFTDTDRLTNPSQETGLASSQKSLGGKGDGRATGQ